MNAPALLARLAAAVRSKWPRTNAYPLALSATQVAALRALLAHEAHWAAFRTVCERYAALAFEELQDPRCEVARVHFLRGQIQTALLLADLPVAITAKAQAYDDRQHTSRHSPAKPDVGSFWGSEYFRRDFESNGDGTGD